MIPLHQQEAVASIKTPGGMTARTGKDAMRPISAVRGRSLAASSTNSSRDVGAPVPEPKVSAVFLGF